MSGCKRKVRPHPGPPLSGGDTTWWAGDFVRSGDQVRAKFGDDPDEFWWDGVATAVDVKNRTIEVEYDDGDVEQEKPFAKVRVKRHAYPPRPAPTDPPIFISDSESDTVKVAA